MALQVEARHVGKVTVMKCAGRIVAGDESEHLHKEFGKLLPEHKHFVLHLGEVNFVDSSGLGLLVRLAASARSASVTSARKHKRSRPRRVILPRSSPGADRYG